MSRGFRNFVFLLFAAAALGATSAARAASEEWAFQHFMPSGMYGFGEQRGFRPPLSDRDMKMMGETLELDEDQREVLADLMRSLVQEFKTEWVHFRESAIDAEIEREAESGEVDWTARMLSMTEENERFTERQNDLVESLFTDLKLVLSPEQEAKWPLVERDRRRATTLGAFALHDVEAVDLVSITSALELTPAQRKVIDPVLDRYAEQLDGLLAARNRAAENVGKKGAAFYVDQMESQQIMRTDPAKAQGFYAEMQKRQEELVPDSLALRDACDKVRDLNLRYIEELRPVIPESEAKDWEKAVSADRPNPMSMFMERSRALAALNMILELENQVTMFSTMLGEESEGLEMISIMRSAEPLSASQRTQVEDLEERHRAREESLRDQHMPKADANSKDDPKTLNLRTPSGTIVLHKVGAEGEGWNSYGAMGMDQPSPELIKELRKLDMDTMRELRGILTINQRAAICMW